MTGIGRWLILMGIAYAILGFVLGIWMGIITSALAFLELLYILVLFFHGDPVPGWASILTVISFMFGILFILIGIIGAYLGSLFETLKNRPRFLVENSSGFQAEEGQVGQPQYWERGSD